MQLKLVGTFLLKGGRPRRDSSYTGLRIAHASLALALCIHLVSTFGGTLKVKHVVRIYCMF